MANHLYYGDNLEVLREHIRDESVDLIYLDPPFNSNATYNVLFRGPSGDQSQAQIEAFEDTWHWNNVAENAFDEVMHGRNADVADMLRAMRSFLKDNDMMAYLTHMAVRLVELHRVLKPTGSIYLHCDPTASHYLKVLMDAVFGNRQFINEIIWERANAHNFKTRFWPRQHDTILFYGKTRAPIIPQYEPYGAEQLARYKADEKGRLYTGQDLTVSLVRRLRQFEWRGVTPPPHRSWGASLDQLEAWLAEGKILLRKDGKPRMDGLKVYLDETPGKQVGTVWGSIDRVKNTSEERLGYPTQKPVALLQRIISASSNPGDIVLDPFCGCGTTVHAAEKLSRQWIGIDVTHLSVALIERRLKYAFPGISYGVHGIPKDIEGARDLAARDKHDFQIWAVTRLDNAVPFRAGKKGADGGIDGHIFFRSGAKTVEKAIVSVKGGGVGVKDIRELIAVVDRERAKIGVYISLEPHTEPMKKEAAGAGLYDGPTGKVPKIQLLTIAELFAGKTPKVPLMERGFKTAAREERDDQSELDI